MATKELLQGLEAGWEEATVGHKFILACVDGSIKPEQFNTWLAQVGRRPCTVGCNKLPERKQQHICIEVNMVWR